MILRISTKGEYGVRIMVDLARHYGEHPRSLTDISQAELLPLAYLEQLIKLLREAEPPLVVSTRGAHGGYKLTRSPAEISMREVLRVLEGPIAPMICATEGEMTQICGFLESCKTRYLWAKLRDAVTSALDGMSLADLLSVPPEQEQEQAAATHFIALSDIQTNLSRRNVEPDMELALTSQEGEPQSSVRQLL